MPKLLSTRERKLLIGFLAEADHGRYVAISQLKGAAALGKSSLAELVKLGLVDQGPADKSPKEVGYRLNPDGFLALHGLTFEEVKEDGRQIRPLKVLQWPPDFTAKPRWIDPGAPPAQE